MELRHLRYFVSVAEELHFGRAAKRVHIAQPSLSRQIRDLEGELGVELFVRDRRAVTLTAAGAALLEPARRILADVADAAQRARRAARGETGRLRIGYVPSVASTRLPAIVKAFRARFPEVSLEMQESVPAAQVQQVRSERLDVAFARGPLREPGFEVEVVLEEPLLAALPTGHALAARRVVRLDWLAREPFLLPARELGPGLHDQLLTLCRDAGFVPCAVDVGTQTQLVTSVAAGGGVAVVPASLRRTAPAGIVFRPLARNPLTQVVMAWLRPPRSPIVESFVAEVHRADGLGPRRSPAG